MVKKLCVIPKNLPSEIIYIIYIITLLTPVILNTCWFFLLIYLFPCIFININITCGHSVNKKKKTLWLSATPQIHSQWFKCLSTSNLPMLHSILKNSQTPSYSATYTFSPTTVSLQYLFSTLHFFCRYSLFIPLRKNTETAQRMASELSTDSTDTSTSSNSSSATSKVSVKAITHLFSQITSNIIIPV